MRLPSSIAYDMPRRAPRNRVQWEVDPDRAVLLVHDMQEYFVRAFDRQADPIASTISNINALHEAAHSAGIPVVFTAQPGNQSRADRALLVDFWGPGLGDDPADTAIVADIEPRESSVLLTKWRYSAFIRTDLLERMCLWGRDQLIITGVYAHIGCLATAMDAFMNDVQTFLPMDGVADFSRAEHIGALNYAADRCSVVTSTAAVIAAVANTSHALKEAVQ